MTPTGLSSYLTFRSAALGVRADAETVVVPAPNSLAQSRA